MWRVSRSSAGGPSLKWRKGHAAEYERVARVRAQRLAEECNLSTPESASGHALVSTWILDSGSCEHLVARHEVPGGADSLRTVANPCALMTANGTVVVKDESEFILQQTGEKVSLKVLESTPAVLSLGKLVTEQGWTFT